jgi:signal transduction histidine kinase
MGFVAFGSTKPKKWEEEQVLLLNLFGEIIAGTLNRQYTMLALEASEARSKAYLKAIPESIFWLDKEGNFLDVKDSPVYTLSIPVSQYPGKNLKDILSVELTQRFLIEINQALANNRVRTFEYKHTKGDKEVFEEARVIRISGNEIMLVIRDITVKKEAHARLLISGEALLKTRQELTVDFIMSTIAHEIKQPLNVIKVILTSTLYLYNKGMIIDTPVLINDIQSVLKQTERINQLINSTASLFHSRKKVAEPVHLGKILESTIQLSAYHIEKLNISVATNLARDIPAIVGNYQHFEQLFINLLENSFAALSNHNIKDKIISIVCRTENNSVIVDFRDNGPGINNNQLEKIFDPFFTTKLENQNRGIGLAIVQSIVRNYNGKISASNAINGGAVFQIHFRIANMNEECIHEYYVS